MTTVADGLFQFGGVPVGTNLDTNKIFSTSTQGRAWFVNTANGTNGNGRSPAQAFTTMQSAFNNLFSSRPLWAFDTIGFTVRPLNTIQRHDYLPTLSCPHLE